MMKMQLLAALATLPLAAACTSSNLPAAPTTEGSASANAVSDKTVECPWLTKVKYPWLSCKHDAYGNVVFDTEPTVMEVSKMPPLDPYVESETYIGH